MVLFGSAAMVHWFDDYGRVPSDTDYLTIEEIPNQQFIEYFRIDFLNEVMKYNSNPTILDPDLLYTIKISHLGWEGKNGKWWKHLKDAVFLKEKGCKLVMPIYDLFYKEWESRFGDKSRISLNKAAEDFFKDGIVREYSHDWLHEQFKVDALPAYTKILADNNSVLPSRRKFNALSKREQLLTAVEECFVIAFERNLSYAEGYKHLVTRLTKGWYNLFLLENAFNILDGFNPEIELYKLKRRKML